LDDLKKEIIGSKKIIESLQGKCDIFAYPYGGIDTINKDNERMVYEAGYKYALTTIPAFIKPGIDRYRIGRINVTNYDGLFRNILYLKGGIIVLSKGKRLLTSQHFYSNISSGGLIAG
jgi:peptidoglycan/xylan/chitin deacetylase (PgdA/CDA1 family)